MLPIKGLASLSGDFVKTPTEAVLCCGTGLRLNIILRDDTWAPNVDLATSLATGLQSLQTEPGGWTSVIQPALAANLNSSAVERLSDTEVVLTLPPLPQYAVREPETIIVTIPAVAVSSKQRLVAAPAQGIVVRAVPSTVLLGGSLYPTVEEAQLRALEGNTLVITLVGDAFLPTVTLPGGASTDLLQGIQSARNESDTSWNRIVRPALSYSDIYWSATNASSLVVRLPQFYQYQVTQPETIQVTIPASATESSRRGAAQATFVVLATPGIIQVRAAHSDPDRHPRCTGNARACTDGSTTSTHVDDVRAQRAHPLML